MFDDVIPEALYQWLLKQPTEKMIEIMSETLDLMQQYNGRTQAWCIMKAGGFTEYVNAEGVTKWKYPLVALTPKKKPTRWPNPINWGKGTIMCPKRTSITVRTTLRDFKKLHEWLGRSIAYLEGR